MAEAPECHNPYSPWPQRNMSKDQIRSQIEALVKATESAPGDLHFVHLKLRAALQRLETPSETAPAAPKPNQGSPPPPKDG